MKNDKTLTIEIHNYLLLDAINNLAIKYSLSVDFIMNVATKRLLEDVEAIAQLRANTYRL